MGALTIPNSFSAGTTIQSSQVNANNSAIVTWSQNGLSDDNLSSSAGMYTAYRTIGTATSLIQNSTGGAADYWLTPGGSPRVESVDTTVQINSIYLASADYAISGRTSKLRIRAQVYVNGTTPAATITVGLFPVSSVAGAAGFFQATLGTVVSGSTVPFSPTSGTKNQGNSGDFTFPADGDYAIGITLSTNLAANSIVSLAAQLQQRWT